MLKPVSSQPAPSDTARLWKAEGMEGISLFKAHFTRFTFARHAHDDFAVGVIESGTQRFSSHQKTHYAPPCSIITVNPGDVHDGEDATGEGYRYRIAYLPVKLVEEMGDGGQPWFTRPVTWDPRFSKRVCNALGLLESGAIGLAQEEIILSTFADLFTHHAGARPEEDYAHANQRRVALACDFINDMAAHDLQLGELSAIAGLSRFHFLRVFKEVTGFTPHAYLIQRRLSLARSAIKSGATLAEAATLSGFADQSHMTRKFKGAFGITPGRYAREYRR